MSDFKTVVSYFGFDPEKVKTMDDFKKAHDGDFVKISNLADRDDLLKPFVDPTIARVKDNAEKEIKRVAKGLGVEFDPKELTGLDTSQMGKHLTGKIKDHFDKQLGELRESAGKGNDEKVREYEKKYSELEKKLQDRESLLAETTNKYNTLEQESASKIKNFQVEHAKKDVFSKLTFKKDIQEVERMGFETIINSKYEFDYDEKEALIIRDKQSKKRITDEKQAGKYKSPVDILNEEAAKANLVPKNPHSQNPIVLPVTKTNGQTSEQSRPEGGPKRIVSTRLRV